LLAACKAGRLDENRGRPGRVDAIKYNNRV